jgi:hypothetical protein
MVKLYVKTVQEKLRKVVSTQQRDWDERLHGVREGPSSAM